jgi:hypothetical protein
MRPLPSWHPPDGIDSSFSLGKHEKNADAPMATSGLTGQNGKRHGLAMHSAIAPFLWIESLVSCAS